MATFPTLTPSSRTFTPGRHPHSEISTLNGLQSRVRTSNVILDQQLRLSFLGLTESEMLSVRSHYIGQRGRFLSFTIPDNLLSGVTTPAYFTPAGYSWIYAKSPQVVDIPCAQRYDVSIELATVPPEGANINGFNFTVTASLTAGAVSGDLAASAPGAALTVAVSLAAGAVSGDLGASVPGAALTVTASLAAGAASGGEVDPNFSSVSLLLHMDGSNNSTTFTDSSSNNFTVTAFGDAKISTAQSKFGGASALFDGIGDYLDISSNADFNYGTGDFTVEFWYRCSTAPSTSPFRRILAHPSSSNAANTFQIWHAGTADTGTIVDGVGLAAPDGLSTVCSVQTAVSDSTWHHIAFARQSGTTRAFLDGVLKQSAADTNNYSRGGTEGVRIGSRGDLATSTFVNGYIDDLRITKGVARYTATFTPPTQALPDA